MMFAVASDSAVSHSFSMDSAMHIKHPFGISPEVKPHRQTVMIEDNRTATESPTQKTPQVRGDNENVRKKLRESLVSALEMVVGKQVVKSVLGVGKDINGEAIVEEKQGSPGQVKAEGEAPSTVESQQVTGLEVLEKSETMNVEDMEAKPQVACNSPAATTESQLETEESPSKKLKPTKEEGTQCLEETKGGLQLMEQVKKVAWDIEAHLFSYNGGVNKKYKEKARSLLFNLKDKSNPELRARVFSGEITPQILVRMSGEQLASKELSQWRTAKAEAFASMVVLTDADVDPRRIVKKTHKGEFQVMNEAEISPSVDIVEPPASFAFLTKKGPEDGGKTDLSQASGYNGQERSKSQHKSPNPRAEEMVRNRSSERGEAMDDLSGDLPTIMSLDEYIDTREETPLERSEPIQLDSDGRTMDKASYTVRDGTMLKTPTGSPSSNIDNSTPKLGRSPSTRSGELGFATAGTKTPSKKRERESAGLLWEGSVQLSATRFAPVDGIFKCGERLELKDWPKSVEIKGRVRLVALDKFLQDLQLSRSRTVTVLSLCPSDRQGADLKQVRAYLKEMADQYRMGDRAGFVEPAPGFELYLLAPGCSSLDLLGDLRIANNQTCERDDEILVGVVVWRRNQSQGVPSTRGPDQIGSVKKVGLSSQVSESPTKVNATPIHWTETPSSGGALPTSLKTTSAHVNVSGNSSMHSTQSRGDSSATRDLSTRREWPPASGLQLSPVGVPAIRVTDNAHGSMPDSHSLPHQSVELEDVPPGFLPRPLQTFPQGRSAGGNVESKERASMFQPPYMGSVAGSPSLISDRSRDSSEAPPGFFPRPSVKAPPATTSQRKYSATLDDDDDDLPEFNFEAEGVMAPQKTANHLPNQAQFLAPQNPRSLPSQSLGTLHTSDSTSRYQGHLNALDHHPPSMEFQAVPSGLPPARLVPLQEESFAARPSLHHGPIIEGWKSSEVRLRENVQHTLHHEVTRPLPPLIAPDIRNVPLRGGGREEMISREDDFRQYGHDSQRGLAGSRDQQRSGVTATPGPYGFQPSISTFGTGVRETLASGPRNELPEWCPPPMVQQPVQRAAIPSPLSFEPQLHNRQQQPSPPVHMVVQHGGGPKNNSVPTWVRGPAPQQESRYDYNSRHVSASNSVSSKWQLNSSQTHHGRSMHPPRKVDSREKERTNDYIAKESDRRRGGRDRTRVRERSRERSLSPTPDRERERGHERKPSRSPTPLKDRSPPSKDSRGNGDLTSELKDAKPPKRERERDQ